MSAPSLPAARVLRPAFARLRFLRSFWRRWFLWVLLAMLVLALLVTVVWLAGRHEVEQTQTVLDRDTADAVSDLRDGHAWRIGMSVCYDLRFPELYRALSRQGAELLLVPSAFTRTTGAAHWEVLLRARAIENLAWVVAPAQGGTHENGRQTWGQSMVVDPWGSIAAQQAEGEAVVLFDIDAARLEAARAQLPALAHSVI